MPYANACSHRTARQPAVGTLVAVPEDWSIKPHTQAKHAILKSYLGAWFAIMAQSGFETRFVFLDGFAGRGRYSGGEPGSPLIALDVLVNHVMFARWGKKTFTFLFVEENQDNYESLDSELAAYWSARGGQPPNVKVQTFHGSFADAAQNVLAALGGKSLAPTFAFVDPFGWKGLPMEVIGKLLAYDRCEVFINFMLDHVNRFVGFGKVQASVQELFGTTTEHLPPPALQGDARRQFLIDLYARQLGTVAGFKYVQNFEMIDSRDRPLYHLFYGTRHLTGLDKMKQAMWKVDPSGGVRFSDRLAGRLVLFGNKPDPEPLIQALRDRFRGETVTVETVERFVILETPYASNHYNRGALAPMERAGWIEVVESSRKRPGAFPPRTKIRFL